MRLPTYLREYEIPSHILSYLESLPQRNTDSMSFGLMFYPERALERVLHGSSTLNTLRRVRGYVREIFESVLSPSSLFSKTPLTLGEFEYVFCVSHSHTRKWHVQHPQVRSWNCIGKGIWNWFERWQQRNDRTSSGIWRTSSWFSNLTTPSEIPRLKWKRCGDIDVDISERSRHS